MGTPPPNNDLIPLDISNAAMEPYHCILNLYGLDYEGSPCISAKRGRQRPLHRSSDVVRMKRCQWRDAGKRSELHHARIPPRCCAGRGFLAIHVSSAPPHPPLPAYRMTTYCTGRSGGPGAAPAAASPAGPSAGAAAPASMEEEGGGAAHRRVTTQGGAMEWTRRPHACARTPRGHVNLGGPGQRRAAQAAGPTMRRSSIGRGRRRDIKDGAEAVTTGRRLQSIGLWGGGRQEFQELGFYASQWAADIWCVTRPSTTMSAMAAAARSLSAVKATSSRSSLFRGDAVAQPACRRLSPRGPFTTRAVSGGSDIRQQATAQHAKQGAWRGRRLGGDPFGAMAGVWAPQWLRHCRHPSRACAQFWTWAAPRCPLFWPAPPA